jgi:hypothetical protein
MGRALQLLARRSPGMLLIYVWAALITLSTLAHVRVTSGFAAGAGALTLVGYPYLVALGLPADKVRSRVRRAAKLLFGALLLLVVIGIFAIPVLDGSAEGAAVSGMAAVGIMAAVVTVNIVIFAPFFLATAALNDLRKSAGVHNAFDSLPNFLAFYFFWFGGIFYVHRQVQSALMPANKSLERTREG